MGLLVIVFMMGQGFFVEPIIGLFGAFIGCVTSTRLMQRSVIKAYPHFADELACEEAIEEQEYGGEKGNHRGPQNLLDLLPEVFTREEAGMLRQRQGIRTGSLSFMLGNWKKRGYIEPSGEKPDDIGRQQFIKTETYLKLHPSMGSSQIVK